MVSLSVSLGLAALSVAAFGPDPALLASFALAAATPQLWRSDVAEHRLPNRLTYPAALAGLVGAGVSWLATGRPPLVPLTAALVFGGSLLLLALVGGMGAGDAKLAVVIGLASPTTTIAVLAPLLAFLAGGVVAVALLIRHGRAARRRHIAFGPFLLAGYFGAVAVAVAGGWG